MKPVNVVLLLLAGALTGAVLVRVSQHSAKVVVTPPTTASVAVAPSMPAVPPEPVAAQTPAEAEDSQPPASTTQAVTEVTKAPPNSTKDTPHARPKFMARRRPAPLQHASAAPVAASPRVMHTPPQRVEIQEPAKPAPVPTVPVSPPLTPEQPKETPPARMEPENATLSSAPLPIAPEPNQATLNAGILIPVRLLDNLSSERNHAGDVFGATLDSELVASGFVIAERGARVEGRVTEADRNGRVLSVELISLHTSDNQDVPIRTERFVKQSEPEHGRTAATIGAGAAIGGIIGGLAGGGKGAAIGVGAGGGAGAGTVLLTRKAAALSVETRVPFRLRSAVTLTERTR